MSTSHHHHHLYYDFRCIYRHALPPGYVLKKDKKKEDKSDQISLEDLIETERAALGTNQKKQALIEEEKKKMKDFKSGKQFGISGREMFSFNPDLVGDDAMDDDEQAFDYIREEDENEADFKEIDFSALSVGLKEVNSSFIYVIS